MVFHPVIISNILGLPGLAEGSQRTCASYRPVCHRSIFTIIIVPYLSQTVSALKIIVSTEKLSKVEVYLASLCSYLRASFITDLVEFPL